MSSLKPLTPDTSAAPSEWSYFPGCSLHSTAREYDESTRAVCAALGISLHELADWNCCGSTSAHSVNHQLARLLPQRNLALAGRTGLGLMIPCAACYGRSKAAEADLRAAAATGEGEVPTIPNRISHVLDVLADADVLLRLAAQIRRPLTGLRTVCYYGCLTSRPPRLTGAADYEDPQSMDQLLAAAGAVVMPWSFKTDCCGASLTLTRSDVVVRLVDRLLRMAQEAGADCVVVACSMCQANLDARQRQTSVAGSDQAGIPVFYVTELLGLALDLPGARGWWRRHLTDPVGLLTARGLA